MPNDGSYGYIAVGSGASVTDPLYKTLFPLGVSELERLKQIAYLMYRAKKDAALCGGNTHMVVLREKEEPIWVSPYHAQTAEEFGPSIDSFLNTILAAVIRPPGDADAKAFADQLTDMIMNSGKYIRDFKFRSINGLDL